MAGVTLVGLLSAGQLWAFNLDDVAAKAKDLAGQKYEAPKSNLPAVFRDMKFADYQQIRFLPDKAEWANEKTPFKLSFYHQGMHFDTPVKINEVTATTGSDPVRPACAPEPVILAAADTGLVPDAPVLCRERGTRR